MNPEFVILVDEQDVPVGTMEKMEAHRRGILHRAFSVFIFDGQGRMLLQQRASDKYHGAGLWSNACCSHPRPNETTADAANRRLMEEMGFSTGLDPVFQFTYRAEVENGLIEHEYDHVFAGIYDGEIRMNSQEVKGYRYWPMEEIKTQMLKHSTRFTSWFMIAFPQIENWLSVEKKKSFNKKGVV